MRCRQQVFAHNRDQISLGKNAAREIYAAGYTPWMGLTIYGWYSNRNKVQYFIVGCRGKSITCLQAIPQLC